MKALVGLIFFLLVSVVLTFVTAPLYRTAIESDLAQKVQTLLSEKGLPAEGIALKNHHLTSLPPIPNDKREEIGKRLDGIIGLYADVEKVSPLLLAPPSFALIQNSKDSIILRGKVQSEAERDFLVRMASMPASEGGTPRPVIDQLTISEEIAKIEDKPALETLTLGLLKNAEGASLNWEPKSLTLSGLLENQEQEKALIAAAQPFLLKESALKNELEIQPYQDPDFGVLRNDKYLVVSGLLPDEATRDRLLAMLMEHSSEMKVVNQTTIANRPREIWWSQHPSQFVPGFFDQTEGPSRVHYYSDRLEAQGLFSEEESLQAAEGILKKLPAGIRNESSFTLPRKPSLAERSEPVLTEEEKGFTRNLKELAVYFDTASETIKPTEIPKIQKAADLILASKSILQGLTVGGYADTRGNADYNRELSLKRARAVRDRLIALGVNEKRLIVNHFGEDISQLAQDQLWKSRRVELSLTPLTAPTE